MGRYMESLRKNLSAYTLDDAPEDVRELYKDEFIQLYASSIKCFLICIKLGFISGRSSFAPRLNQIWRLFGGFTLNPLRPLAVALCRVAVKPEKRLALWEIGFFGLAAFSAVSPTRCCIPPESSPTI